MNLPPKYINQFLPNKQENTQPVEKKEPKKSNTLTTGWQVNKQNILDQISNEGVSQ